MRREKALDVGGATPARETGSLHPVGEGATSGLDVLRREALSQRNISPTTSSNFTVHTHVPGYGRWRYGSVVESGRFGSPLGSLRKSKDGKSGIVADSLDCGLPCIYRRDGDAYLLVARGASGGCALQDVGRLQLLRS